MDTQYPTAPELPGKGKEDDARVEPVSIENGAPDTPKIQLIASTKPANPETPTAASFYTEKEQTEFDKLEAEEEAELNEHVYIPADPDGVIAAERARQSEHPLPAGPARKRGRRWPIVLLVLVLLAAAAGGAYWFGNHKASAPTAKPATSQTSKQPASKVATVPTKHYDSVTYTLGFDYPEDWVVSDTTSKLTVTSPAIQLKDVNGSAQSAHVIVTIQNPQTTIPGYPSGGALAALESDKLTYKQPTAVQRAQTYFSYLSYHQQDNGIDQMFVTGDNGYQQGQQVPMSDVIKGNPLVSVAFATCTTVDCGGSGKVTPITVQAGAWKDAAVSKQVTDLLQSMQLN